MSPAARPKLFATTPHRALIGFGDLFVGPLPLVFFIHPALQLAFAYSMGDET